MPENVTVFGAPLVDGSITFSHRVIMNPEHDAKAIVFSLLRNLDPVTATYVLRFFVEETALSIPAGVAEHLMMILGEAHGLFDRIVPEETTLLEEEEEEGDGHTVGVPPFSDKDEDKDEEESDEA